MSYQTKQNAISNEKTLNKMKGFIDPISLGFILALGIGLVGSTVNQSAVNEGQLALENQEQSELACPSQEEPKS